MMRSRLFVSTAFVVALVFASTSFAQERGEGQGRRGGQRQGRNFRGPGGFGGFGRTLDKLTLIRSNQVREELKVTEEQGTKIDEVLTAYREAQRDLFSGFPGRDASEDEVAKWREESTKKREKLSKETVAKLDKALEKKQVKRLNEIHLQQQGIDGLTAAPVVAALKINEEQVGKIKKAITTRDEGLREIRGSFRGRGRRGGGQGGGQGGAGGFEEIREKSDKLRKDTEKSVLAVLSEEQKTAFEKLKGEKFELDRSQLRGRFGGGRGQGGQGGRGQGGRGQGGGGGQRRRPPVDDEV